MGHSPAASGTFDMTKCRFVQAVDMDGDGIADVPCVYDYGASSTTTFIQKLGGIAPAGVPPNKLISTLGQGGGIGVIYKPLSSPWTYVRDAGTAAAVFPQQDIQGPIFVASAVSAGNGIGGTRTTNYTYGGLKAELGTGRGLLGFRWMKSKELATNIENYTEFRQDFPYTGIPSLSETRLAGSGNAGVLKRTAIIPACKIPQTAAACTLAAGNRYFPHVASTAEQSWELNGTAYPSITSSYVYGVDPVDGKIYGDPTQITVTNSADGSSKSTVNEYWPANTASGNWILGRLKRATVTSVKP